MEAKDIDGEAVWTSEAIDISSNPNVSIVLDISETGSSTNVSKYVRVYYVLDASPETLFETNGDNTGNFGSQTSSQTLLNGSTLQLVVRINNPNAGDATIFDNITVFNDQEPPEINSITVLNSTSLKLSFSEELEQNSAELLSNFQVAGIGQPISATLSVDKMSINLVCVSEFIENQSYSITISNIEDLSGNIMSKTSLNFTFIPFEIENLFVLNESELLLEFSHSLEIISAETTVNYFINNSIGNPVMVNLIEDTLVQLTFTNFSINTNYLLSISNVKDENEIIIETTNLNFTYYPGNPFDLVISELMVDVSPSPSVLPATKFVEIYNRTQSAIDLSGWLLQIGDYTPRAIENYLLEANGHLLLVPSGKGDEFENYGNVMDILSESQLTVSGTSIKLSNKEGELVDYVNYSDSWYNDESKREGGWSLERIDTENFCGEESNWKASIDYKGGTPGKENSVKAENVDDKPFDLINIEVLSSNKLALIFSKNITEQTALEITNYQLDDGSNTLLFVQFSDTSRTTITLQFTEQFIDGQEQFLHMANLQDFCGNIIETDAPFVYYLIYPVAAYAESSTFVRVVFSEEIETATAQNTVNYSVNDGIGNPSLAYRHTERKNEVFLEFPVEFSNSSNFLLAIENVTDLNGNVIKPAELSFSYFIPSNNDLIINELLFNPKPEGVDFVEIYNKASMPVDLSKMSLARRNEEGELESVKQLSELNRFLEPGIFLAISSDTSKTKSDYPAAGYDQFIQIPVLPSYNDDEGNVVLLYGDSIIDEFAYDEKMHFALITDEEGISLERIDPLKSANDPDNWHSAAESVGFATPANQNSQFRQLSDGINEEISIEPETFSPNNDGYDDIVFIRYKFEEPGYVANVSIYDGKGRLVKRIANNELLGTEGEFSWDGLFENQTKGRIGIYVVYFEVFNLQGVVKKTKKTCVLAARLN